MKNILFIALVAMVVAAVGCQSNEPSCGGLSIELGSNDTILTVGETVEYELQVSTKDALRIASATEGWNVRLNGNELIVAAPLDIVEANRHCEVIIESDCHCAALHRSSLHFMVVKEVTLTFEDADARFAPYTIEGCGKMITTWSDLIDDVQYGGALLYNDFVSTGYRWHDAGNTELASALIDNSPFWSGGHAVSNYYNADITTTSYETQLEVATGAPGSAGNNGLAHFCIHNGYVDDASYKTACPSFYFADGVERVVRSMYVVNTSYVLNSLINGDAFSPAATDTTWLKIIATGYNANGQQTGLAEFYLCNGREVVAEWSEWQLHALGKVVKIEFNLQASSDLIGQFGLMTPAYFAYDDVTVWM